MCGSVPRNRSSSAVWRLRRAHRPIAWVLGLKGRPSPDRMSDRTAFMGKTLVAVLAAHGMFACGRAPPPAASPLAPSPLDELIARTAGTTPALVGDGSFSLERVDRAVNGVVAVAMVGD